MKKPKKRFVCVELKRRAQEKITADLKGMSLGQVLEYSRTTTESEPFWRRWRSLGKRKVAV